MKKKRKEEKKRNRKGKRKRKRQKVSNLIFNVKSKQIRKMTLHLKAR